MSETPNNRSENLKEEILLKGDERELELPPQMEDPEGRFLELQKDINKREGKIADRKLNKNIKDLKKELKSNSEDRTELPSSDPEAEKKPEKDKKALPLDGLSDDEKREKIREARKEVEDDLNKRVEEKRARWEAARAKTAEPEKSVDVKDATEPSKTETVVSAEKPEETKVESAPEIKPEEKTNSVKFIDKRGGDEDFFKKEIKQKNKREELRKRRGAGELLSSQELATLGGNVEKKSYEEPVILETPENNSAENLENKNNNDYEPEGWGSVLERENETKPEEKIETPESKFKNLLEEKNKVESQLSKAETKEDKEKLTKQKKEKSFEVLKQGCETSGVDFKEKEKELEQLKEQEWQQTITIQFGSPENYKAWEQQMLLQNKKVLDAKYAEIINSKDNTLSERQREKLLDPKNGAIRVGGWRGIILEKEDVAICAKLGLDVNNLRFKKFGFSNKLELGEQEFEDMAQFNKFLATEKEKYIKEEAEKRSEERKKLTIDQTLEQVVLDKEIKKIENGILAKELLAKKLKEDNLKKAEEQKRQEESEQKIEKAKNLLPKEKLAIINNLRKNWSKAEKIFDLLHAGKGKIKSEDKRILEVGKDNEELEEGRKNYSTEVVRFANELTGRNLMTEAMREVGYNPKEEPKNLEKQKEFRNLLTQKIKEAYQNAKTEIENSTGKKIKLKKKTKTSKIKDLETIEESLSVS